ncbi:uncharacterized protein BDR25DRAFT_302100 [Lindgomyces ingoldianus]|uniref:Uncharacterized protein n=1 Tax=Lindgomyces ingoldianus TaxID=673940 RepID=A0ACB6R1F9_9PLEO|nr:uncharacterized protein BDR25DRAFT_302100 [Lindgomyces ingoldianus]KAF2473084.1 hypothetical protein BDR25DRAFT_302100 [Lindgomyces ingoldianus]
MSGLEVVGAVAAVVSAFHGGAELVAHIKKKRRRRSKSQQEFEEKQLQDSLQTGETTVGQRYVADIKELGEIVRIGDAVARDRLLHIAVVMQAEIIKSLQLAVKYENAVLNLKILHEASILNRQETIVTLDELKQRILITRPVLRTLEAPPPATPEGQRHSISSLESVQGFRTAASFNTVPDDYIPEAVTIPGPGDLKESKTGLAKYFQMRRQNSTSSTASGQHRPTSSTGSINFSPALNYLIQGSDNRGSIMKDIDEIISSYQGLRLDDNKRDTLAILNGGNNGSKRDTLAILQGGENYKRDTIGLNRDALQMLRNLPPTPEESHEGPEYPAFNHNIFDPQNAYSQYFTPAPIPLPQRHSSKDSRWSTSSSVYSDTVPPSLYSHDSKSSNESRTPSIAPDFSALNSPSASPIPPFSTPQRPRTPIMEDGGALKAGRTRVHLVPVQDSSSSGGNNTSRPFGISALASSSASLVSPQPIPPVPTPAPASAPGPPTPVLKHTNSAGSYSSAPSFRSNTIAGPLPTQERMMDGRPCKDNNYWGFCKGAWAVREELKKGIGLHTRPIGQYNTIQIWQCKQCTFSGKTYAGKKKKEVVVDPNIHTSAVGIRYKWIFLAKSHVKKKNGDSSGKMSEDCNYGCVICSVEGNVTGIYGNVETLMNHIFLEHVRDLSEKTAQKAKIVMGREASRDEEWDLNVPTMDVLSEKEIARVDGLMM